MKIDGRCQCGYVSFEAEADPETTTLCNCTDCQTMSGAPFRAEPYPAVIGDANDDHVH